MLRQVGMRSFPTPHPNPQPHFIKIEPHTNPRHDRRGDQAIPVPFVGLVYAQSGVGKGVRAFCKTLTNAKLRRENSNLRPARNLVDDLRFVDFAPRRRLQRATPHDAAAVVRSGPEEGKVYTHGVVLLRNGQRFLMKVIIHRREKRWVERASRVRRR